MSLNRVTNGVSCVLDLSLPFLSTDRVASPLYSLDSQATYVDAIAKVFKQAQCLGASRFSSVPLLLP